MDIEASFIKKLNSIRTRDDNGHLTIIGRFLVTTIEEKPKLLCLSVTGDKVKQLKKLIEDDRLCITAFLESKEKNGCYYTSCVATKIKVHMPENPEKIKNIYRIRNDIRPV